MGSPHPATPPPPPVKYGFFWAVVRVTYFKHLTWNMTMLIDNHHWALLKLTHTHGKWPSGQGACAVSRQSRFSSTFVHLAFPWDPSNSLVSRPGLYPLQTKQKCMGGGVGEGGSVQICHFHLLKKKNQKQPTPSLPPPPPPTQKKKKKKKKNDA